MNLVNTSALSANFTMAFAQTGHEQIVVAARATFDLPEAPGGACRLSETQLPLVEADVPGPDPARSANLFETDFAAFKPRCDVMVHGRGHAPDGRPVTVLPVGLRLGGWAKKLTLHGPRIWLRGAAGLHPSDRRPFVAQAISYDTAYGGTDPDPADPARAASYEQNPSGIGYYPLLPDREGRHLAQSTAFGEDAVDPNGRFAPMALGPVGRHWLPRRRHAGTYDEAWAATRMPFLPADFNELYYQSAAEDQQIPYPQGGEPFELVNLSPRGRVAGNLPAMQVVISFERTTGRITQRIANLDTVVFLPDAHQLTLTWRTRLTAVRDIFEFRQFILRLRDPAEAAHG